MIRYPDELPIPTSDYGLQHVEPMIRTQMVSGRARQRRRFTGTPSMADCSWVMTNKQMQYFEGWYRYVIQDGADWFECPLYTPMGLQHYVARFTEMYSGPRPFAVTQWRISGKIEIRERQTIPVEWARYGKEFHFSADIIDKAANREWPESKWQTYMCDTDEAINKEWPEA